MPGASGQPAPALSTSVRRELLAASLAGSGLLAAGLLAELHRRRRRQSRSRPPGHRIAACEPEPARAEAAIRAAADPAAATTLQAVLRSLTASDGPADPAGQVLAVQLSPTGLTVRLTEPRPAPDRWTATSECEWRLDPAGRQQILTDAGLGRVDPFPALVTAGSTGDGQYLLVNLAAFGVVTVTGPDPDQVSRQVQTMALELATAPWGGPWFELATVGLPDLHGFERAVPYPDLPAALAALRSRVHDAEAACRDAGTTDPVGARAADPDDDRLQPIVVVSTRSPSVAELAELQALTGTVPGLAAALLPAGLDASAGPDPATAGALQLTDEGTIRIPALPAEVRPVLLDLADITAILALFATADAVTPAATPTVGSGPVNLAPELDALPHLTDDPRSPTVEEDLPADAPPAPDPPPADHSTDDPTRPAGGEPAAAPARFRAVDDDRSPHAHGKNGPDGRPEPGLLVRLLGPPDVTGSARPVTTSHGMELIVALALRGPAGLDSHRLADLLGAGGDIPVTAAYRQQIVSRVRAQLGPAVDGRPRILYAAGVYRLHSDTGSDLDLFRAHSAAGTRAGLRAALALVRGPALDGVDYWWLPDLAGAAQAEIRAAVVDAADRLTAADLNAGDPAAAVAAALAGLRVDPDERLYRGLIRAHAAAGNLAGVAQAWQDCLAVLADLGVPSPHPQTVEAYQQARGTPAGRPVSAGSGRR